MPNIDNPIDREIKEEEPLFTINVDGDPVAIRQYSDERDGKGYVHNVPDLEKYADFYEIRGGYLYEKDDDEEESVSDGRPLYRVSIKNGVLELYA